MDFAHNGFSPQRDNIMRTCIFMTTCQPKLGYCFSIRTICHLNFSLNTRRMIDLKDHAFPIQELKWEYLLFMQNAQDYTENT